jgi:hypothetical protein
VLTLIITIKKRKNEKKLFDCNPSFDNWFCIGSN